jgi:hypothetical protein
LKGGTGEKSEKGKEAADSRQKSEVRRQTTEDRRQTTEIDLNGFKDLNGLNDMSNGQQTTDEPGGLPR